MSYDFRNSTKHNKTKRARGSDGHIGDIVDNEATTVQALKSQVKRNAPELYKRHASRSAQSKWVVLKSLSECVAAGLKDSRIQRVENLLKTSVKENEDEINDILDNLQEKIKNNNKNQDQDDTSTNPSQEQQPQQQKTPAATNDSQLLLQVHAAIQRLEEKNEKQKEDNAKQFEALQAQVKEVQTKQQRLQQYQRPRV